jgi:hypothetical protein
MRRHRTDVCDFSTSQIVRSVVPTHLAHHKDDHQEKYESSGSAASKLLDCLLLTSRRFTPRLRGRAPSEILPHF